MERMFLKQPQPKILFTFEILLDAEHRLTISRNCLHAMDKFLGEAEDADRVLELSRSITHAA